MTLPPAIARRPLVASTIFIVAPLVVIKGLDAVLAVPVPDLLARRLIIEACFVAYVIALMTWLHLSRDAGFVAPTSVRRVVACLPLLYLPALVLAGGGWRPAGMSRVIGMTAFACMVAFAEEGLLRGVVLHVLGDLGVRRAVLLSSLIFGLAHLGNVMLGHDLLTVGVQATYATLLGIGFAGMRLYTGSIWPAVALHALIDLADFATRGFDFPTPRTLTARDAIAPILLTALTALYGMWLLRLTQRRRPA